jgi:hypothetical protein
MTTVSIMQPYFLPFAEYFRLFAASDVFVLLDDVQFPRRGWVHRNRLHDRGGELCNYLHRQVDRIRRLRGHTDTIKRLQK